MKRLLLFIFLAISAALSWGQNDTEDPKVGLVLSGGGAKGLAHIGALKIIEDSGIQIDYIGGTSMGAIIGGLYASGYSARQLDSIFEELDFDELIQDEIPRKAKTFYEKTESDKYAVTLPFDGFKVSFPSGLSKGQNVYNLFSKLTSHISEIDDFSELPIPFFCVATNVETGEEILLEKGYLPQAISASGALPSLFSPVIIDDKVLIDGGVKNNYPVDQLRAKGMDIIIGVDVQDSLKTREDLNSAFDVLVQINNFRTIEDMKSKREQTDVYINPNIDEFTVVSFDEGRKIIEAGEEAAAVYKEQLEGIAGKQTSRNRVQVALSKESSIFIESVEIAGNVNYTRAYVMGKLKLKVPDEVSYERLSEGINNLSATGSFQNINYRMVETPKGTHKLYFDLRESDSRTLLRLSAHYDDLYRTAALINVTRKRLFTNNDIASFDFIVGDNLRYNFNYYVDKGYYWSIGLNSRYSFFEKDVKTDFIVPEMIEDQNLQLNELQLKYGDLTNQLYVETLFRRTFLIGAGIEHKWLRYLSETIGIDENNLPRTVFENTNYFGVYGYLRYDTMDNTFFPSQGIVLDGDFHFYGFANGSNENFEEFSIAKANLAYALEISDDFTMVLSTEGGFKIGGRNTRSLDFFVGGYGFQQINNIVPLYGYEALSIRGDTYLKSAVTFDYEFVKNNHLNLSANISNVGDRLFETGNWIDEIDYRGYAIGYGMETFLGPLELKYAYSPEVDNGEWYVRIGFSF
ncbi:patatin-like phospholipase family protein [Aureitalea sp. L0-47]|uniref:patatin-like phospholipase family protein n=1 Tax=Aureitalea sp. L0-47 TaxID=2816962 RepID=UPI0022377C95|nr:patatin-like phospholipase family protein [Aureitalea sp. L0-47]MCW5518287.1 patatin-like phospholipase family protein [Aureitalea sp. L0-47]